MKERGRRMNLSLILRLSVTNQNGHSSQQPTLLSRLTHCKHFPKEIDELKYWDQGGIADLRDSQNNLKKSRWLYVGPKRKCVHSLKKAQ